MAKGSKKSKRTKKVDSTDASQNSETEQERCTEVTPGCQCKHKPFYDEIWEENNFAS